MKKWMVYYIDDNGARAGNKFIWAHNKKDAMDLYKQHFGAYNKECSVVAVIDSDTIAYLSSQHGDD